MPIKPSPTIAGKLRKLFSNNKQTIEPAIGDSVPGGSGGGALIVRFTGDEVTMRQMSDKTMKQIYEASLTGPVICIVYDEDLQQTVSFPVIVAKTDGDTPDIYLYSTNTSMVTFPLGEPYNTYTDDGTEWLCPG